MNLFDENTQEKDPRNFERNSRRMSSTTSKVGNVCAAQRGKEHRMREVEMEEKLNKEAKKDV